MKTKTETAGSARTLELESADGTRLHASLFEAEASWSRPGLPRRLRPEPRTLDRWSRHLLDAGRLEDVFDDAPK